MIGTPNWPDKYMLVPFQDGGRDITALDCWGLAQMILREECGIHVPDYGEISATELIRIATQIDQDANDPKIWQPVSHPQAFDVAVMRWFGKRSIGHVGIMIDKNRVLHTEEKSGPVIADVSHYSIASRMVFFRRHIGLVQTGGHPS